MRPLLGLVLTASLCACQVTVTVDGGTSFDETGEPIDTYETGTGTETSESDTSESETGEPTSDLPDELDDCERLEQLVDVIEADPASADAAIDAFVRTVSYGAQGFPIVVGQRLCAVWLGPDANVAITGDFNDWSADAHPLTVVGGELAYAQIELPTPPSGLYKFVLDGSEYVADPLARRFGWDEFGEYSQLDALPDRSHHERWPGFDQGVGDLAPRTLTVWLPAGTFEGPQLPSLYMHDGQNLFAPDALWGGWQVGWTLDDALANAVLDPLIVVGIDNTPARMDEYTQVGDVIDGMMLGGRADAYAAFLVDGVKPFIDSRYPVAPGRESTAVMGSSLGGLVSLYIGQQYPQVFAGVASMSGTIAWGTIGASNPTIIDSYLSAPPEDLRIYIDSGGSEGIGCPEDGSDNYCGNVELAEALRGLGWVDEVDLFYRWDPGAPHNEAAWATRLLPALLDWF